MTDPRLQLIHLGPLKTILNGLEYLFKKMDQLTYDLVRPPPSNVVIDPANICNLSCPLCPTGAGVLDMKQEVMKLKTFKMILNKMPFIKTINLFNWGEPFLNKDVFKMIKLAKERGIFVNIHSNFNFQKGANFLKDIIESGLDLLVISLDGASQESYSKYKVGGNFNLVLSNMKKLREIQKRVGVKHPKIIWKFIVNKYNEHEIHQAKKMANETGVKIIFDKIGLADDLPDLKKPLGNIEQNKRTWLPIEKVEFIHDYYKRKYALPLRSDSCYWLFNSMVINPDGTISPCCWVTSKSSIFGDLNKASFKEIWNGPLYQYSRSLFINKKYKGPKLKTICEKCNNFMKAKSITNP